MVISVASRVDTQAEDAAIATLFDLPDVVAEAGDAAKDIVKPDMLSALSKQPGPVKRPIQWTSEKQRRAYFATDGFGGGIPYQRTGKLAQSWDIFSKQARQVYRLIVENLSDAAQFVYGALNQRSAGEARRPQQRFHANTGWPLAILIINPGLQRFEIAFNDHLEQRFDDLLVKKGSRRSRRS